MPPPDHPKIYHITHVDNLPSIIEMEGLLSDAMMIARGGPPQTIGMSGIKQARLTMPVLCHPGDFVGDYVPFNFCSRSVMLGIIYYANHPALTYRGGQGPIVHLEADLHQVVRWANDRERRWAFTLSNARAAYTQFRASLDELDEIDWAAVVAPKWSGPGIPSEVKEAKQAEFLMHESFPWGLVTRIGVRSQQVFSKAQESLRATDHRPRVEICPGWYY